ncbi:WUSCHEL-related homeobox 11-like [Salvia splendens]|uniref:WUSCHEL-related homeobox 11-like n=1 Tax=Salvia splendens TaxID=180675 RepID=UPI001C263AEC|nr:WUSCHEL-related homeobox 11-like [Salvia splendens]
MEDPDRATGSRQQHNGEGEQPVRSRWAPKPEQILILETIFNSGMVNPPKDETIRIRKLLEKFGSVADANVFYWFQNRRSRSRRRQRQVQANLIAAEQPPPPPQIHYDHSFAAAGLAPNSISYSMFNSASSSSSSPSSFTIDGNCADNSGCGFGLSGYPGLPEEFEQNPIFCPAEAPNPQIQSQMMTVFINGVATEVRRGPVDIKSMFGADLVMFDSSGLAVEMNEYGYVVQGLEHGQSYFLVPRIP